MPEYRVLLTDYAWPDVEIERSTLADVDAELIVATAQDEDALVAAARGVDAIMTNWAKVTSRVMAAAPNCRIVARLGIGLDNIDLQYATEHKMVVTNVPDYCLTEVAEHALALLLAQARKVVFYDRETKAGRYDLRAGVQLRRVAGQTLGIVGWGNIGRQMAQKGEAIGLRILAASRSRSNPLAGVEWRTLDQLLGESDYVSLHLPLNGETRHIIGAPQLARMKPSAYLINTARGGLIDHAALAAALEAGQLAGAALDVQEPEPPDLAQPPFNDPRVIVTPHAAFVSAESLDNLRARTAAQVADVLRGRRPENVINPEVLD